MAEKNRLSLPEDRAARVVREALKQASRDMELIAQRHIAQGRSKRVLGQMNAALEDLAREYGVRLTNTQWGKSIVEAAKLGAAAVEGAAFTLSKAQIDAALWNAQVKIKGLVAEGAAAVQEIVAGAMIKGDSLRDISRAVQARVKVEGGLIDQVRADQIARNELFSVYRQTSDAAAVASGVTLLQMRGPIDRRTSKKCLAHVGEVHTRTEWLKIYGKLVLIYGAHHQCRHTWDPVRDKESPAVKRYGKLAEKQVERVNAAA